MVSFTTTILRFDEMGEKTGWTYIEVAAEYAEKLKPGNKLGTISDDGAALSAILSILSPKEAAKCIKFVRGRAIKLIGDKADANGKFPTKDQAKELVENTLGDLLVRREGNKRLELL